MPSSEPEKTPARLTRGWWGGLAAGLTILLGYALFNVLVDPSGAFGQSGRYAFNRSPPPDVIAFREGGGSPASFARAIRERRQGVFLIGNSRVGRGFDTCSRPEVLRIAGSGWGLRQLTQVERMILNGRATPAVVLIEIGLPTRERPALVDSVQSAMSRALSPRMALQSAQTVMHSLTGDPSDLSGDLPCRWLSSVHQDWGQAEIGARYRLTQLDTSAESLAVGRQNLADMADRADDICRKTGVRHRVVFFTLPAMPADAPITDQDPIFQVNATRIATMFADRSPGERGCDIRYVNFASTPPGDEAAQALWRDRGQWYDYFHFSTRLGEAALEALLRQTEAHVLTERTD